MEAILQAHKTAMPVREVLVSLAEKFSNSEERSGKIEVQMKQVWNWFQNRRYAIRAKAAKSPGKLNITQMTRDDSGMVRGIPPQATQPHAASSATVRSLPQAPQHPTVPSAVVRTFPQAPQHPAAFSGRTTSFGYLVVHVIAIILALSPVQRAGRVADNSQMEYEAKSARDGAWYDVSTFLSHRSLETGDPEVMVRFAGFGAEEDEWVNVRKNVRQRSLPCESSECVAVLPADLILCFQEGKEQALYFDAHVLDAQRRRHDVRGCRCRFLVRYDHDQSEEIVALRKICRRPETDYRLQQLHAVNESLSANHNKNGANNIHTVSTLRVYPPAEVQPKQNKVEPVVQSLPAEVPQKRQRLDSTFPPPLPEGSQKQLKVEPAMVAPPGVPQNQQRVQPAPPPSALSEAPQYQNKAEPVAPSPSAQPLVEPHKVEHVAPSPSAQPLVEPKKDEAVVPVPPAVDSAKVQVATGSQEVPPELHEVQPVTHDPSTELLPTIVAPAEPKVAEPLNDLVMSDTSVEVPPELHKVQPAMPGPSADVSADEQMETKKAEPQKEEPAVVSGTSVEVPSELHEVQPVAAQVEPMVVDEPQKEPVVSGTSVEVPSELQEVQLVIPDSSTAVSVVAPMEPKVAEPQKEEPMVSDPSVEVPSELQEVPSVEVPSELQEVQPVIPDSLIEPTAVAVPMEPKVDEPQKEEHTVSAPSVEVQPVMPDPSVEVLPSVSEPQREPVVSFPSVEIPSELQEVQPTMHDGPPTEVSPAVVAPVEPKIAEPQKEEPMLSDPSVEVPSEVQPVIPGPLTEVLAAEPIEPNVAEPQKEEPMVSGPSVEPDEPHTSGLEAMETKAEESVTTETEVEEPANVIQQPKLAEIKEGGVDEVGNPELPVEN
ncbi:hypothetical protein OSB04_014915 [Centaurea solstitialis]|uniref:Homeobox domain-containing protein n=1 Tax=Centaurea solstitialis TaxID=347529 RepID=A0AA38T9Y5_9ASTR|nr:hypothetical protein OSB04_014915 [Centaurea solstitialis]